MENTLELTKNNEVNELLSFLKELEDNNIDFQQIPLIGFKKTITTSNQEVAEKINTFKSELLKGNGVKKLTSFIQHITSNIKNEGFKQTIEKYNLSNYITVKESTEENINFDLNISNLTFNIDTNKNFEVNKKYFENTIITNIENFFEKTLQKEISKEEKQFIKSILQNKNVVKPNFNSLNLSKSSFELINKKSNTLYDTFLKFINNTTNSSMELQKELEKTDETDEKFTNLRKEYSNGHGGIIFNKRTTTTIINNNGEIIKRGEHKEGYIDEINEIMELLQSPNSKVSQIELHAVKSEGNKPIDLSKIINVLTQLNQMNINIEQKFNFKVVPLGQHKAHGLYIEGYGIVAVDGKAPSSILHEIIHLIDITNIQNNPNLMNEREQIIDFGSKKLDLSSVPTKKVDYYSNPYEIIARMGEIAGLLMVEENIANNIDGNNIIPTQSTDISLIKDRETYLQKKGLYFNFDSWSKTEQKRVVEFYKSFFTLDSTIELKEAQKQTISTKSKINKEEETILDIENDGDIEINDKDKEVIGNLEKDFEYIVSTVVRNKSDFATIYVNGQETLVKYKNYMEELMKQIRVGQKKQGTTKERKYLNSLNEIRTKTTISKMLAYCTVDDIKEMLEENEKTQQMEVTELVMFLINNFTMVNDNLYLKVKKTPTKQGTMYSDTSSLSYPEIMTNVQTRSDILYYILKFVGTQHPEYYEEIKEIFKEKKPVIFNQGLYQTWVGGSRWKNPKNFEREGEENTVEKMLQFFKEGIDPLQGVVETKEVEEEPIKEKLNFIIPSSYQELKSLYKEDFINYEELTSDLDKKIIDLIQNEDTLNHEERQQIIENILIEINEDLKIEEIEKELEKDNVLVFDIETDSYTIEKNNGEENNGYDENYNKVFKKGEYEKLRNYFKSEFKKKLNIKTKGLNL